MKKNLPLSLLAAAVLFPLSGCVTTVAVTNPHDANNAQWVKFVSGDLIVRYPGKTIDEVKVAVDRAFDELYGRGSRQGETPAQQVNPRVDPSWEVVARSADIRIEARISTQRLKRQSGAAKGGETPPEPAPKADEPQEWTQLVVSYGAFGNLKESQKIVGIIAKHLN
ncbi:MAG: hypothetical protein LBD01_00680 [Puniceicoccales bacterium]|jgi:hypothetical protein|nr:hypothetical protein [Puniceicoccales bacterium]